MTYWMFPMKPVRVPYSGVSAHELGSYWMERKFDGHRAIAIVGRGRIFLKTRQNREMAVPEEMRKSLTSLGMKEGTVLDGEIWNPERRGGWTSKRGQASVLTFWDCMMDAGTDLSSRTIEERREALVKNVDGGREDVRIVEWEEASVERVEEVFRETAEVRRVSRSGFVHGVVLKRRGSPRRDRPTGSREHPDWLKIVFDGMRGWG